MTDNVRRIGDALKGARPALGGRVCATCAHSVAGENGALTCAAPDGPHVGNRVKPGATCETYLPKTQSAGPAEDAPFDVVPVDLADAIDPDDRMLADDVPAAVDVSQSAEVVSLDVARAEKKKARKKKDRPAPAEGSAVRRFVFPLPPDCGVSALGLNGRSYYYLDASRQIVTLSDKDHARLPLTALFGGNVDYLTAWLPAKNQYGIITGPQFECVGASLMTAAKDAGIWEPRDRVRGRGIWQGADGLIVHLGNHILTKTGVWVPGLVDGHVYPARPRLMTPTSGGEFPGEAMFTYFKQWNWVRPVLDPLLLTGFMATCWLTGALPVRPPVFITGSKSVGKSTLHDAIKLFLDNWLQWITEASPAYVTGALEHDCLPVAIDEQEASEDGSTNKAKQLVELARLTYSGGRKGRGSPDQSVREFTLRSPMMFSAVLPPPMEGTDKSRFAILRLRPLPLDAKEPDMNPDRLRAMGRAALSVLLRDQGQMVTRYQTIAQALRATGHDARGQKTFGTLLMGAWMLLGDEAVKRLGLPLGNNVDDLRELLDTRTLAELQSIDEIWRECLTVLLTAPCDAYRGGGQTSVEQVLEQLFEEDEDHHPLLSFKEAAKTLRKTGLALIRPTHRGGAMRLFIPNNHMQVRNLFRGTKFFGTAGDGGWRNALQLCPPGTWDFAQARIGSQSPRGIAVDVNLCLGRDRPAEAGEDMDDAEGWM
jgi:hypothetical protein